MTGSVLGHAPNEIVANDSADTIVVSVMAATRQRIVNFIFSNVTSKPGKTIRDIKNYFMIINYEQFIHFNFE